MKVPAWLNDPIWYHNRGDTLFRYSVGRTDLYGGSSKTLLHSLETKLMTLPDNTLVLPGHGPATSIGDERRGNPFLDYCHQ